MRKVTEDIARAFVNGQKKTVSNTSTDGVSVWLHGHEIIRKDGADVRVSLCGWGTPTTRERLNGILSFAGYDVRFFQQNHEQFVQSGRGLLPVHVDVFDLIKVKSNGQIGQMYKDWHR
tara:strand:- start:53 stop:406 length:354 start_codon:yes stop_codon:yes gene_type:complete